MSPAYERLALAVPRIIDPDPDPDPEAAAATTSTATSATWPSSTTPASTGTPDHCEVGAPAAFLSWRETRDGARFQGCPEGAVRPHRDPVRL
jgi:hypothetical protein